MAVFRVERNTGYTVMSNHHLRNKELSLKAKGAVISNVVFAGGLGPTPLRGCPISTGKVSTLSVPPFGSLKKPDISQGRQGRDEKGKMTAIEYTIYEQPQPPELDCPVLEKTNSG